MAFRVGERVQVSPDYNWAPGAIGTVSNYPNFGPPAPNQQRADETTMLISRNGETYEEAWVIFDEPQSDIDGEGGYVGGAIACSALTPVR